MKKKIILVLTILAFIYMFCACSESTKTTESLTITVLDNTNYGHSADLFDVTTLSNAEVNINKALEGVQKTVMYMGTSYELLYERSITYLFGDITVDQYSIVGSEKGSVLLLPNGAIYAIIGIPVKSLDISKYDDSDKVRIEAEKAFSSVIDFSAFEYVNVNESLSDKTNGFGLYQFVWFNMIGNVMSDRIITMSVKQDGEVSSIWLKNAVEQNFDISDDLNFEDYALNIEQKLIEIYGNDFIDYEIHSTELTLFKGKPSIVYQLGIHYIEDGQEKSEARQIVCEI